MTAQVTATVLALALLVIVGAFVAAGLRRLERGHEDGMSAPRAWWVAWRMSRCWRQGGLLYEADGKH